MKNGAAYCQNPRRCPACDKEQTPQKDSMSNPIFRTCECGQQWRNVFRNGKLMGYDPKVT